VRSPAGGLERIEPRLENGYLLADLGDGPFVLQFRRVTIRP
jgi:hypothetical protein